MAGPSGDVVTLRPTRAYRTTIVALMVATGALFLVLAVRDDPWAAAFVIPAVIGGVDVLRTKVTVCRSTGVVTVRRAFTQVEAQADDVLAVRVPRWGSVILTLLHPKGIKQRWVGGLNTGLPPGPPPTRRPSPPYDVLAAALDVEVVSVWPQSRSVDRQVMEPRVSFGPPFTYVVAITWVLTAALIVMGVGLALTAGYLLLHAV